MITHSPIYYSTAKRREIFSRRFVAVSELRGRETRFLLELLAEKTGGGIPERLRDLFRAHVGKAQKFLRLFDLLPDRVFFRRHARRLFHKPIDGVFVIVEVFGKFRVRHLFRRVLRKIPHDFAGGAFWGRRASHLRAEQFQQKRA